MRQEEQRSIFVNYSFEEDAFIELDVQGRTRKRGRAQIWLTELPKCYDTKLPISEAKKKDLITLCNKNIIPEEFHEYYKALPSQTSTKDRLPVPTNDETDQNTDTD